jgi:ornithine decarboxylase
MIVDVFPVSRRLESFLSASELATPVLVLDPDVVADRYVAFLTAFSAATVHFAVKACPEPAVLHRLQTLGCSFDVASRDEVRRALSAGAAPSALCYGNPIRSPGDVADASKAGVTRFVTDSVEDLGVLAEHAAGARIQVRLLVSDNGAAAPFAGKFGAAPGEAIRLLRETAATGLSAEGVAFHVGSQQTRPAAYAEAARQALAVAGAAGLRRPVLNVGGGFPVPYRSPVPDLSSFATAIDAAVRTAVRTGVVEGVDLMVEPGRAVAAEAGVLRARVLRVSHRPGLDHRRWVYLNVGRYSGLAETEGEAIAYPLRVPGRAGPHGPVVLAGPTCDGDDVLYRRTPCELPLSLRAGDAVDLLVAGAYTASYSSIGFNGIPPLMVHVL